MWSNVTTIMGQKCDTKKLENKLRKKRREKNIPFIIKAKGNNKSRIVKGKEKQKRRHEEDTKIKEEKRRRQRLKKNKLAVKRYIINKRSLNERCSICLHFPFRHFLSFANQGCFFHWPSTSPDNWGTIRTRLVATFIDELIS